MKDTCRSIIEMCRIDVKFSNAVCNSVGEPLEITGTHELSILYHPSDISESEARHLANTMLPQDMLKYANGQLLGMDDRIVIMHTDVFESFKRIVSKDRY